MTATPGQRAYEAMHASRMKRAGIEDPDYAAWEALDVMTGEDGLRREDMEAAAQAVLGDAFPGLRKQLDEATAERDDYAARLKAADQSWTKLAAERDQALGRNDELSTELSRVKSLYAGLLGEFTHSGDGYRARLSGVLLARKYAAANLPVRDDLSKLAGQ